jgi:anti-sigma factor (TIGR02949 family)
MKPAKTLKACRAVLLEFSKYLDGEQSEASCRRIERHLQSCASCAAATDQIRQVVASCRQMKKQALPQEVRARAARRVKALLRPGLFRAEDERQ